MRRLFFVLLGFLFFGLLGAVFGLFGVGYLQAWGLFDYWINIGQPEFKPVQILEMRCRNAIIMTETGSIYSINIAGNGPKWRPVEVENWVVSESSIYSLVEWEARKAVKPIGAVDFMETASQGPEHYCYSAFAIVQSGDLYWWKHNEPNLYLLLFYYPRIGLVVGILGFAAFLLIRARIKKRDRS